MWRKYVQNKLIKPAGYVHGIDRLLRCDLVLYFFFVISINLSKIMSGYNRGWWCIIEQGELEILYV